MSSTCYLHQGAPTPAIKPGWLNCKYRRNTEFAVRQTTNAVKSQYGGPKTGGERLLEQNRANLRLFLDTAEVSLWQQFLPTGAIYGVTTNPLLLERAGEKCTIENLAEMASEAFSLGVEEVQLQTWGGTADAYAKTGLELAYIDPRVVVKVPLSPEGLEAANELVRRGHRVTMTGIYDAHQVLLAAAIGSEYAAPYLGRMNAKTEKGLEEIITMKEIVEGMDSELRILVASIRTMEQVSKLASFGITDFALPPDIFGQMLFNDSTMEAASDFERAAEAMGAEMPTEEADFEDGERSTSLKLEDIIPKKK